MFYISSVSEGRMLPRKALQHSGPELDSGSLDAESYHQETFLQDSKVQNTVHL